MAQIETGTSRRLGTMIDDSAVLAKLSNYMVQEPGMSVPQAVRKIGVTDSASIHRIGSKYKSQAGSKAKPSLNQRLDLKVDVKIPTKNTGNMALSSQRPTTRKSNPPVEEDVGLQTVEAPTPVAQQQQTKPHMSAPQKSATPAPGFAPWLNTSVAMSSTAMQNQMKLTDQMMRTMPVTALMRQQVEIGKMMFSLMTKSPFSMFPTNTKKK